MAAIYSAGAFGNKQALMESDLSPSHVQLSHHAAIRMMRTKTAYCKIQNYIGRASLEGSCPTQLSRAQMDLSSYSGRTG